MGLGLPALFLHPTGSTHLVEALEAGYSVLTPWEDTKEGVEGSLLSSVATKAIKGNLELPEAGHACQTPNMTTPYPPYFKWVGSKMELVHKEARLVVRVCKTVSHDYVKARQEGKGRQPHTSEETLFCGNSEVKIVAMAGTSDSKFQLKVRRTFPIGRFKGELAETNSGGEFPVRGGMRVKVGWNGWGMLYKTALTVTSLPVTLHLCDTHDTRDKNPQAAVGKLEVGV